MKNANEILLKTHLYCKLVWEMLTASMLKASQHAIDGESIISKIIKSERKSKAQF